MSHVRLALVFPCMPMCILSWIDLQADFAVHNVQRPYLQASWGKAQVLHARDRVRTSATCTSVDAESSASSMQI